MMLKLILVVMLLESCLGYGSYGVPNCRLIYPEPDADNEVSTTICAYKDYVISNNATFWSPKPDCNQCVCRNGVLQCCLYGIKKGPIAVPLWCEIQTIGESCKYKLVYKSNKNRECTF